MLDKIAIRKILLAMIVLLVLGSCRSTYQMPNDTFKHNGGEYKWYQHQERGIIKTVHHPRWANNKR